MTVTYVPSDLPFIKFEVEPVESTHVMSYSTFRTSASRLLRAAAIGAVISVSCGAAYADTYRGTIRSVIEDDLDAGTARSFLVLEPDGRLGVPLKIDSTAEFQLSNFVDSEVIIDGVVNAYVLTPASFAAVPSRRDATVRSETSLSLLTGIFDLSDASVPATTTEAAIRNDLTGDTAKSARVLFENNSYGAVTIGQSDVASRVTLAVSSVTSRDSCYAWYAGSFLPAARAALAAQGYDQASYDRVLYIVPNNIGDTCGFVGLAISSRDTLYSGDVSPSLVAHELGHNFGLGHASADTNNDGLIDQEYGDPACIMGSFGGHYNLLHALKQSWFLAAGGRIETMAGIGTQLFEMSAAELPPTGAAHVQLLRVDPPSGGRPYFVTFRKNSGTLDPYFDLDGYSNNQIYILRTTTELRSNTLLVKVLRFGESFEAFDEGGVLIEFLGESSSTASVRVTRGPSDTDGDGIPNSVDPDQDNDGTPNATDCAPTDARYFTNDGVYLDPDEDGVPNSGTVINDAFFCVGTAGPNHLYTLNAGPPFDNCPTTSNADQRDTNSNGRGDACESGGGTTPGESGPAVRLRSARIRAGTLNVTLSSTGSTSIPSVSCSVKLPGKAAAPPFRAGRRVEAHGTTITVRCSVPGRRRGTYDVAARACEQSLCRTSQFRVVR